MRGLSYDGVMPTVTESKPTVARRLCPMYKVLLHDDEVHFMDEVVVYITKAVPQVPVKAAVQIMLAAHHGGSAVVVTCPLEYAELYRDRLESYGLTATLEADG
jgi:ATP-dependent Clp protease adaptor protein ClpS